MQHDAHLLVFTSQLQLYSLLGYTNEDTLCDYEHALSGASASCPYQDIHVEAAQNDDTDRGGGLPVSPFQN